MHLCLYRRFTDQNRARLTWEPWVRGSRGHEACWT
ncbi:hypothetical protein ERO13_A06G144666v2 [Gossypium hirsutum]|nr:hypothetical protein ERO13_A06G144666v2 [Gossypium hirsutum]